jgi:hypothetical protein
VADLSTPYDPSGGSDLEQQDLADIQSQSQAADDAAVAAAGEVTIQHGDMTIKHSN